MDIEKLISKETQRGIMGIDCFVEMPSGRVYVYWHSCKLVLHSSYNYGYGKMHWVELITGDVTKEKIRKAYPNVSYRTFDDPRTEKYIKEKIKEIEDIEIGKM
jgi:hypothetical protein